MDHTSGERTLELLQSAVSTAQQACNMQRFVALLLAAQTKKLAKLRQEEEEILPVFNMVLENPAQHNRTEAELCVIRKFVTDVEFKRAFEAVAPLFFCNYYAQDPQEAWQELYSYWNNLLADDETDRKADHIDEAVDHVFRILESYGLPAQTLEKIKGKLVSEGLLRRWMQCLYSGLRDWEAVLQDTISFVKNLD